MGVSFAFNVNESSESDHCAWRIAFSAQLSDRALLATSFKIQVVIFFGSFLALIDFKEVESLLFLNRLVDMVKSLGNELKRTWLRFSCDSHNCILVDLSLM